MSWRKVWIVARHEYLTNIRRWGFIVMTVIVPLLGIITLLIGVFFGTQAQFIGRYLKEQADVGTQITGVVDESGYFTTISPEYRDSFVPYPSVEEARAALKDGTVSKVLLIGDDYLLTGRVVVMSDDKFDAALVADSDTVRSFLVTHLLSGQVSSDVLQRAAYPMYVETLDVSEIEGHEGAQGKSGRGAAFSLLIPYAVSILLMMTIFVSSGYLLQSVAEEKESRVIEIIISSVRPVELMAGKVIGLGALGLTQVLVWVGSVIGFTGGATAWLTSENALSIIPTRMLVLSVVYYVLGYTLYAVLMAGVGALGTTMRESQQLAGIFSFFASIPYMVTAFLFANPNALFARILGYFPLTAPTMMMLRISLGDVPTVDVVGSILILLLSIPATLWIGTRAFRVGLLIYDKRPTLRELRCILRGK